MKNLNKLSWNFVTEKNRWAIYQDGYELCKRLNKKNIITYISSRALIKKNNIIHYGSLNMFKSSMLQKSKIISRIFRYFFNNYYVVSFFHGNLDTNKKFEKKINFLLNRMDLIDYVAIPNLIMLKRLKEWGVDRNKIIIVKVGFDSKLFIKNSNSNELKKKFNLPQKKFVIGSFQKDGDGWGEGLSPKMIKGPDIFCNVINELNKKFKIHVLLTGPARGYVKKFLNENNISYTHNYLDNYKDLPVFYSMLDLYLITSREEGGPKSLIECMSMKIPFVSTKVGVAKEIFKFTESDIFCDIDDIESMVKKSAQILNDLKNFKLNIDYDIIKNHDFDFIAGQYLEIYNKLNLIKSN